MDKTRIALIGKCKTSVEEIKKIMCRNYEILLHDREVLSDEELKSVGIFPVYNIQKPDPQETCQSKCSVCGIMFNDFPNESMCKKCRCKFWNRKFNKKTYR